MCILTESGMFAGGMFAGGMLKTFVCSVSRLGG